MAAHPAQTPGPATADPAAAQRAWPIHQGFLVRESERAALAGTEADPARDQIQINVGVQQVAETDYEVTLKLEGKAESSGTVLFAFDLTFAGVFRIQNVPQERCSRWS